jgi:hypothetical protein
MKRAADCLVNLAKMGLVVMVMGVTVMYPIIIVWAYVSETNLSALERILAAVLSVGWLFYFAWLLLDSDPPPYLGGRGEPGKRAVTPTPDSFINRETSRPVRGKREPRD